MAAKEIEICTAAPHVGGWQAGGRRAGGAHSELPDDSAAPLARKKSSKAVAATRLFTSAAGRQPAPASAIYVPAAAVESGPSWTQQLASQNKRHARWTAMQLQRSSSMPAPTHPTHPTHHPHLQWCLPACALGPPQAPCHPPAAAPPASKRVRQRNSVMTSSMTQRQGEGTERALANESAPQY